AFTSSSSTAHPDQNPPLEKQKPNYKPTGLLASLSNTSTTHPDIVLKYHEPPTARLPPASQPYLLYIFEGDALLQTIKLNERSCWLIGREGKVCDIVLSEKEGGDGQYAVLQFKMDEKKGKVGLYVLDLESEGGTVLNGEGLDGARYVGLRDGDVLGFGGGGKKRKERGEREYVLLVPKAG
ncbi:MAG: hypothetical protein Q9190_001813, partial [Brigantiaea leucoxantha]